jgi:drug/metabolite transporter (DMT)-like permease
MNSEITCFEVLASRYFIQAVLSEIQMRFFTKTNPNKERTSSVPYFHWKPSEYRLIVFWLFMSTAAWLFLYYSLTCLPVGLTEAIQNLTPLMTLVLGYFALRESLHRLEVVNMCLSFAAVIFIVVFSGKPKEAGVSEENQKSMGQYFLSLLACIASAFLFAVINVILRVLKHLEAIAL